MNTVPSANPSADAAFIHLRDIAGGLAGETIDPNVLQALSKANAVNDAVLAPKRHSSIWMT